MEAFNANSTDDSICQIMALMLIGRRQLCTEAFLQIHHHRPIASGGNLLFSRECCGRLLMCDDEPCSSVGRSVFLEVVEGREQLDAQIFGCRWFLRIRASHKLSLIGHMTFDLDNHCYRKCFSSLLKPIGLVSIVTDVSHTVSVCLPVFQKVSAVLSRSVFLLFAFSLGLIFIVPYQCSSSGSYLPMILCLSVKGSVLFLWLWKIFSLSALSPYLLGFRGQNPYFAVPVRYIFGQR
ncbi:hypothetical protein DPX16_2802 [Anabarilius grahami]|uniref:Uncharacterized protein n=1 Tax=Anabarilius grahami TaxID=495550 RepID=A0A3N0YX60_ANAGA|nr:hypothetical protein DPX16_2802 [Anabarilius grahami]